MSWNNARVVDSKGDILFTGQEDMMYIEYLPPLPPEHANDNDWYFRNDKQD